MDHITTISFGLYLFFQPSKSPLFYLARLDYYHSGFWFYFSFSRWFLWSISWEYCPFLFGLYSSLVIAWTHPFHLPHSSVSNCVLLEDLFSVSHLTVSYHMWKWNLYSLWCLFVCFFLLLVCTNLLRCQLWNLFLWHLSWQLHRVPFCFNL